MPSLPELRPHDVSISERVTFNGIGGQVKKTVITYYLGNHGPFTDEYVTAEIKPTTINDGIEARQRLYSNVTGMGESNA